MGQTVTTANAEKLPPKPPSCKSSTKASLHTKKMAASTLHVVRIVRLGESEADIAAASSWPECVTTDCLTVIPMCLSLAQDSGACLQHLGFDPPSPRYEGQCASLWQDWQVAIQNINDTSQAVYVDIPPNDGCLVCLDNLYPTEDLDNMELPPCYISGRADNILLVHVYCKHAAVFLLLDITTKRCLNMSELRYASTNGPCPFVATISPDQTNIALQPHIERPNTPPHGFILSAAHPTANIRTCEALTPDATVTFDPAGQTLALSPPWRLELIDVTTSVDSSSARIWTQRPAACQLTYSPSGSVLAAAWGKPSSLVTLYNPTTLEAMSEFNIDYQGTPPMSLISFNRSGTMVRLPHKQEVCVYKLFSCFSVPKLASLCADVVKEISPNLDTASRVIAAYSKQ